jgi:hypothetical protein
VPGASKRAFRGILSLPSFIHYSSFDPIIFSPFSFDLSPLSFSYLSCTDTNNS